MANLAGKYQFVSQENFDAYLKAIGVGALKATIIKQTTPDIVIEVDGSSFVIQTITALKTIKVEFELGKEYEADPGTGRKAKYVTTLDGDTLYTKEVEDPSSHVTRKFADGQMVMTMVSGDVTAVRIFKKA